MDFGDILNQWNSGGGPSKKKKRDATPEKKRSERKSEASESFENLLDRYTPEKLGFGDKDADIPPGPREDIDFLKRMRVQDTLDLHGMTAQQAGNALTAFMLQARSRGLRKVLIIHGKGMHSEAEPVLSRVVREYLAKCPFAGKTGSPDRSEGGNGALWVMLKQDYRSR